MVKDGKLSRAFKTVTCNKCGHMGHNKRSCKGQTMNQPVGSSTQVGSRSQSSTQGASTQATGAASKGRKRSSSTQAAAASAPKKQKKKATGGGNGGSQNKDKVAV